MEKTSNNDQTRSEVGDTYINNIDKGLDTLLEVINLDSYQTQETTLDNTNTIVHVGCVLRKLSEDEQEKLKQTIRSEVSQALSSNSQQQIFNFKIDYNTEQIRVKIDNKDVVVCHNIPNIVVCTKLQNGKIMERKIGMDKNKKQYTQEEIKILIKQAECGYKTNITKNSGRYDRFTFLSIIVNMDNELVGNNSRNPTRFITPDNKDKDKTYEEICNIVKQAKQDPNSPNILLIPYSADGHIVTLLVDKREFPNRNSVACFDSSHYFNKFGSLNPKHFSKDLLYTLDAHQKPINKSIIQKWSGTCSFYTEAFCYLVSKYIQDKKNEGVDLNLNDISNHINSKEFTKQLKKKKKEFFKQYKATMEEVERKQDRQKEKIKNEIIKYKEQNSLESRQLTQDERHYQQLLNQYGVYRYGQGFMGIINEINDINGINNSNPFNPDQQNALVSDFINSEILNEIEPTIPVLSRFAHFDDAGRENIAQNGQYNFIFTTGVGSSMNQQGTHYVAAQIFRDESTNRLVVLHYDSLNGTVSDEFERYIRNEFGEDIQIVNISNQNRFTQQEQGAYTCGLCALTALRDNGILD